MATLAVDRFDAGVRAVRERASPRDAVTRPADPAPIAIATVPYERSVYSPSRRSGPVSIVASAGIILAAAAALATLGVSRKHEERPRLAVVELRELDTTPPPPAPQPTTLAQPEAAETRTVVPRPMIELPAPGPVQVMVDAPPPPAPVQATTEGAKPSAAPAVATAAAPMDGGDLSSKVLYAKPPVYPVDARRAREQGTVRLMVLVGPDGCVKDIEVATSSGSQRLDRAALGAVRRWRWSPSMNAGTAVAVRGYVTIPFVLKG